MSRGGWGVVARLADVLGILGFLGLIYKAAVDGWWIHAAVWWVTVAVAIGVPIRARRWSRRRAVRRAAQNFADKLHSRWFQDAIGNHDSEYRVSVFMPHPNGVAPKEWRCVARTIAPSAGMVWRHVSDPKKLPYAGIVVNTAARQRPLQCDGVPVALRTEPAEVNRYRRDGFISAEKQDERSWKWATLATTFARADNGTILCVVVVERESGEPIASARYNPDEFQLAADAWSCIPWGAA